MSSFSSGQSRHLKRTMIFIDGGYFRKFLEDMVNEGCFRKFLDKGLTSESIKKPEIIAYGLSVLLFEIVNKINASIYHHEIIRVYYYDGKSLEDPEFRKKDDFFNLIKNNFGLLQTTIPFEMKFGRLIKSSKDEKPRQKGVDVLLSVDIVAKAFLDHYDEAVIVAGDDDFLDAVTSVKDFTGKKVIGFYSSKGKSSRASVRLIDNFDVKHELDMEKFAENIQQAK